MGAVYQDGGMPAVYTVYKELLSPFILYVAKYSKDVYKEPKEQFIIRGGRDYKLRPLFKVSSEAEMKIITAEIRG